MIVTSASNTVGFASGRCLTLCRPVQEPLLLIHRCHSTVAAAAKTFDYPQIRNEIINVWLEQEAAQTCAAASRQAMYCTFTYQDGRRAYYEPKAMWHWLDRELSSNLAGETGAVYIYKGALAAMKWKMAWMNATVKSSNNKDSNIQEALEFCKEHCQNESQHLQMFNNIVHETKHTRLLPLWKLAGFTLGFMPTLMGGNPALYVTVNSVETFVEEHFQDQIVPLDTAGKTPELVRLLQHCCEDEVHHKEDAARKLLGYNNNHTTTTETAATNSSTPDFDAWWVGPWSTIVKAGSRMAAQVARQI